jgi:hypothetical protein
VDAASATRHRLRRLPRCDLYGDRILDDLHHGHMTASQNGNRWGFRVYQFAAGASIGNGGIVGFRLDRCTESQAITTTQDNSAIVYVGADWTATDGATRTWRTINGITPTSGKWPGEGLLPRVRFTQYTVYTGYWNDAGAAGSKTTG